VPGGFFSIDLLVGEMEMAYGRMGWEGSGQPGSGVAHSHSNRILVTKYCCEKIIRHTQLPKPAAVNHDD